jgi:hypothetical protein
VTCADDEGVQVTTQSDPIVLVEETGTVEVLPSTEAPIVVTVEEECVDIVLLDDSPVLCMFDEDPIEIVFAEAELIILEVGLQGPAGPEGPQGPPGSPGGTIPEDKFRFYRVLVGTIDGVNDTFTLPSGDKARNNDPGFMVQVVLNGQELYPGAARDFTVSESGGAGTGFDTVVFAEPPKASGPAPDQPWAHYVLL